MYKCPATVLRWSFKNLKNNQFVFAYRRTLCTKPTEILQRAGNINILLPLPNAEKCFFHLHPNKTVDELISDIREEKRENSQIVLSDKDGNRISHSTLMSQLIREPFNIKIDDQSFSIDPMNIQIVHEPILSTQDLKDITTHIYYQKIQSLLASQNRHHMPYSEYLQWCHSYGLSDAQATVLIRSLHKVGIILHFHEKENLKGYIFLKPEEIWNSLGESLDLKYLTRNASELRLELEKLLPVYDPLNKMKIQLDEKAERRAKWWMRGALVYLVIQFSILARMVWIDFNWDIMEPVTYFVGALTMMGGYTFYVLYSEDYTYNALEKRQKLLALKKFYISEEFNWKKWNKLNQKVQTLKKLLGESLSTSGS